MSGRRLAMENGPTKSFDDHLAPLKRYLQKQVGRPWNDVFSEICEHSDTGSVVKMHVREHVAGFVVQHVRRGRDGALYCTLQYSGEAKLVDSWQEFYVDPDDGLLKSVRELCKQLGTIPIRERLKKNRKRQKPSYVRQVSRLAWHMKFEGIWYLVELSTHPRDKYGDQLSVSALHQLLSQKGWRDQNDGRPVRKKQLSRKELKEYCLSNSRKETSV